MLKSHVWISTPRFGKKFRSPRRPALKGCPFKKGIVTKISIMTPRKPNSARRRVARVRIGKKGTKKLYWVYIFGSCHRIQEYATVLVRGGRTVDLPGLKYKLVHGKYDFRAPEDERRKKHSKYGIKLSTLKPKDKDN